MKLMLNMQNKREKKWEGRDIKEETRKRRKKEEVLNEKEKRGEKNIIKIFQKYIKLDYEKNEGKNKTIDQTMETKSKNKDFSFPRYLKWRYFWDF